MRKACPWFLLEIESDKWGLSGRVGSASCEDEKKIHRTQMCIPLKPVFSRHKRDGVQITDEPTGNLDSATTVEVIGLLKASCRKYRQTILMVTHNEAIAQTCDRIIHIEDGRIVPGKRRLSEKKHFQKGGDGLC